MKRKRKVGNLFVATAAFAVAASAIVPSVASAAQFTDIQGNTHEEAIKALVSTGIINGYPNGTFKPNKELTRSDVVKLLGKYLVANGCNIPSDYKVKMRFTDLTSNSSNELLQYAALVKDAGIFNGSNGKLNANEKMTRENMAVVLVKALTAVQQVNYIAYVEKRNFTKEILDIQDAKESSRSAIDVLDYFDITEVQNFNPKDIITRGQFASFLYRVTNIQIPTLSVQSVEVLSANQLSVTLSNETTHTVTLAEPLKENVKTNVKFDINGTSFTADVTYKGLSSKPDKEETKLHSFKVESDGLLFAVTSDGRLVETDDVNLKVFGFIGESKVEIPSSAYNVTTQSKYLKVTGNKVTADFEAIKADKILENETDRYEAKIVVTMNDTGETITHTITLAREEVAAKGKFELVDRKSISGKLLKDIDVDITTTDISLVTSKIFEEILEEGYFDIEDQYGQEVSFSAATGEVTFFDGTSRPVRLIISDINSTTDKNVVTSNGVSPTIKLGTDGLTEGDSFKLTLSIDNLSQTIKVYLR